MRVCLVLLLAANSCAQWQMQASHTKESLRGVSVVNAKVVWASGTRGTYLLTSDGGKNWAAHQVPGAESLDFRGVKAFGSHVFLLAAGPGDKSRIYHTSDSGNHWELQFTNPEPKGFLDCMAFSDEQHGIVVGDPVNGKFQLLRTEDGGKNWHSVDSKNMPPALDGEGAFAASNSCITASGENAWYVTGGSTARVFHSSDGGTNWSVAETPLVHRAASRGVFSVAFKDVRHGVIAGGDYSHPEQAGANLALTDDGGRTWRLAAVQGPASPRPGSAGFVYCVSIGQNDKPLSEKHRDHALSGEWRDYRECHLKPDLLLIYRKPDSQVLQLVRLGSHSELFG
jgi:photosystem II stability/assembly factor-like uncharacterized protein/mRNA-degrading endonuclease YafQ of YafQ-DinJ toxin-antitoxin module